MALRSDRRVPLNRERVLQAALCLADEAGIDSLSMRRLGQALGVEAMALYNHVANKDDLLDGLVDLVFAEFEQPAVDEDWEPAIRKLATSAHDALVRHPWSCALILSTTRIRPARLRYMEALMRCLREAGFSADQTYHAYHIVDSHILGFTLWQLGHAMPADAPRLTTKEEFAVFLATALPGLSIDDYPYLLEHVEQHIRPSSPRDESEFEFGLRLILEGLQRMRDTPDISPRARSGRRREPRR